VEDLCDPWLHPALDVLSERARGYIKKALGPDTQTRRSKILKKFRDWLGEKGKSSLDGADIINYLVELPQNLMSQFCTIRTAINTTIHQNIGYNFSDNLFFKKLAKGVIKDFPLDPRYDEMWDIEMLYKYVKAFKPPDPTKQNKWLRTKANILVRASIAGRNGDVAHIHRGSIVWEESSVRFRFFKWKTQAHTSMRYSNFFKVKKLVDPELCPFRALKQYMDLHRQDYKRIQSDSIWLNYRGDAAIEPSTLANCARDVMREAGIDPLFGAGTIRHAAITYWREQGVSMAKVIERTQHRSEGLVRKFYDKSCTKVDIMADILDGWEDNDEGPQDFPNEQIAAGVA
jgi:hypothetical protein